MKGYECPEIGPDDVHLWVQGCRGSCRNGGFQVGYHGVQ